jgi:hypothetical protein
MEMNPNRINVKEGEDYYLEGEFMVFTSAYLLKRGYCCGNNCRHCPYDQGKEKSKKTKTR